jgi:hypothetical protein
VELGQCIILEPARVKGPGHKTTSRVTSYKCEFAVSHYTTEFAVTCYKSESAVTRYKSEFVVTRYKSEFAVSHFKTGIAVPCNVLCALHTVTCIARDYKVVLLFLITALLLLGVWVSISVRLFKLSEKVSDFL